MADDLITPDDKPEINPITGLEFKPGKKNQYRGNLLFTGIDYKDPLKKYAEYGAPLSPYFDLEEQRARLQSTGEKWRRGLAKAAVTTAGAVAENTIGLVDGMIESAWNKDFNRFSNNAIGNIVDSANEWMRENFPHYVTEAERNMTAAESVGTANFWSDQVLNGLGYSLGSIGTLFATGGVGLITRGAALTTKGLTRGAKAMGAYNAAKAVVSGTKAAQVLKGTLTTKVVSGLKQAELGVMMSHAEASVEARESLRAQRERLKAERAAELGVDSDKLPASELRAIEEKAKSMANIAYALNLGVLAGTNVFMFGKTLLPRYSNLRPGIKGLSVNSKTGQVVDTFENLGLLKTIGKKYAPGMVKNAVTETFQESTQFAISESVDELYDAKLTDIPEIMLKGYMETFGSKEGMQSAIVGGIVGMMSGGFGSVRRALNAPEESKQRKAIVEALNDPELLNVISRANELDESGEIAQRMQIAFEKGNHREFRNLQLRLLMGTVLQHEASGSIDALLDRIDSVSQMSNEDFAAFTGLPIETVEDKQKFLSNLKEDIKKVVDKKRNLDRKFPSSRTQGLPRMMMSKKALEEEEKIAQDEDLLKRELLRHSMELEDSDERIEKLRTEVNSFANKEVLKQEDFKYGNEEAPSVEDAMAVALSEITNPEQQQEAVEKVQDMFYLKTQRDLALNALNELYKNPKSREKYINRKKAEQDKAAQEAEVAKLNTEADEVLKTTNTVSEMVDALQNNPDLAERIKNNREVRQKVANEQLARTQKEANLKDRFDKMTLADVKNLSELTDAEKAYRDTYLKSRTTEEPLKTEGPTTQEQNSATQPEVKTGETAEGSTQEGSNEGEDPGKNTDLSDLTQPQERQISYTQTDSKGRVYTYYATTTTAPNGVVTTTFTFNRSDKSPDQRNKAHVPLEVAIAESHLQGEWEENPDEKIDGEATIQGVSEIRTYPDTEEFSNDNLPIADVRYSVVGPGGYGTFDGSVRLVPKEAKPEDDSDAGSGSDGVSMLTRYKGNGAYRTLGPSDSGKILVDSEGQPFETDLFLQDLVNGKMVEVFPEILANEAIAEGTEVYLEVVETDWWKENKDKRNAVKDIPIFIRPANSKTGKPGMRVGKLTSGNSKLRAQVVAEYNKGNNTTVKTTISQKFASNRNTATTESKKPYYSNVLEVMGTSEFGLIIIDTVPESTGVKRLNLIKTFNGALPAEIRPWIEPVDADSFKFGQVLMTYKNPKGEYVVHPLHTATINEKEADEIMKLMTDSSKESLKSLKYLLGNSIYDPALSEAGRYWMANDKLNRRNEREYEYQRVGTDKAIKVTNKMIQSLLNGERIDVEQFKNTPAYLNLVQGVSYNAAKERFETSNRDDNKDLFADQMFPSDEALDKFLNEELLTELREFLLLKKRNISQDDSADVLTDKMLEEHTPREEFEGYAGVLATDLLRIKGSLYMNIGLKLADIGSTVGQEEAESEEHTEAPADAKPTVTSDVTANVIDSADDLPFVTEPEEPKQKKEVTYTDPNTGEERSTSDLTDLGLRARPRAERILNKKEAQQWLAERGIPVTFYDQAKEIGDIVIHGMASNGAVELWSRAEVGTEYHEAFHVVFRSMLNNAKRQSLYDEVKSRSGNEKLSDLELEEIMAEEFRDYVLTLKETAPTLGAKVRKFFNDLWNFIKAVLNFPTDTAQIYSLIESNKFPKSFERNTQRLQASPAFHTVRRASISRDYTAHKHLVDTIVTEFIDEIETIDLESQQVSTRDAKSEETIKYRNDKLRELLGSAEDKGKIASTFLYRTVSKDEGKGLNAIEFAEYKAAVDSQDDSKILSVMQKYGLKFIPPNTSDVRAEKYYKQGVASAFYSVYKNWNDDTDELGNVIDFGFRSVMIMAAQPYGIKISREAVDVEIQETEYDKLYNKSHFEVSAVAKIGDEIRRIFSRIEGANTNSLGVRTYADVNSVVKQLVAASVGKSGFDNILSAIREKSEIYDDLKPVVEYFEQESSAPDAAKLTHILSLDYSEFRELLVETEYEETDEKPAPIKAVRVLDSKSDSATNKAYYTREWRLRGVERGTYNPAAALKENSVGGGLVFNNNFIDGKNRADWLNEAAPKVDTAEGVADVFWYSGLRFSENKKEHDRRVAKSYRDNPKDLSSNAVAVLNKLGQLKRGRGRNAKYESFAPRVVNGKPAVLPNIFRSGSELMNNIAEYAAEYEIPRALSHLNATGKMIHPYNLPTPLSTTLKQVNAIEAKDKSYVTDVVNKDEALRAYGRTKYASVLKLIANNPDLTISHNTLDALTVNEESKEHGDLYDRDYLVLRLNKFLNNGNEEFQLALPTQESRSRTDFISIPRFDSSLSRLVDGKSSDRIDVIKGIIVRDLIRNKKLGLRGDKAIFHLSGITDDVYSGVLTLSDMVENAMTDTTGEILDPFDAAIEKLAQTYLNTVFDQSRRDMADELVKLKILSIKNGQLSWSDVTDISDDIRKYQNPAAFITSYVFNNLVGKIEVAEFFMGGIHTFNGDVNKFYKRMKLLTTPGNKLMLRGEYAKDPNYGMLKNFNEITISKFKIEDDWHNKNSDNIEAELIRQGYTKEQAKAIADPLRTTAEKDISDAQAFISPIMFKHIEQGLGRWTAEDDVWFKDYMENDGPWLAKYTPAYKFYYEELKNIDGITVKEMDKNSYVVVTRDLAKGSDVLTAMHDFMLSRNVHVINTESAKKGYVKNQYTINQSNPTKSFEAVGEINVQRGSNLYMPQIINESATRYARINRQVRKNMFSELENPEYHEAVNNLLQEEAKNLLEELGYTQMMNNPEDKEARLNFLQKIKDFIIENEMKNGEFDKNTQDQLKIIVDFETGEYDFNLPMYFPAYQRKFQNLIFSLFRNNIYKMNAPGSELVQVASPGKFKINGEKRELRYISVDENGNVGHAEVMVSRDFLKKHGLKVGDTGFSYRIPHQGYSSTIPVKIVGVLPEGYSKTIIVPGNIVVTTGSDFDIDKLFTIFGNKNPKTRSEELMNEIVKHIENASLSKETLAQTLSPLDQKDIDDLVKDLQSSEKDVATTDSNVSQRDTYYVGNIKPEPNTIFVFGSNPIGVNGNPKTNTGGAALVASTQFGVKQGEKMDNKLSDSGNAYGLTTVTGPGKKRSIAPSQITENVKQMYETAKANPNKTFKVAYRHTGNKKSLNGYSGNELIEMFNQAGPVPSNVVFSKEWFDTGKLKIKDAGDASNNNKKKFDHSLNDMVVQRTFKASAKLVGIHANALAGLAVLAAKRNGNPGEALINGSKVFEIDGERFEKITAKDAEGNSVFYRTSQRLSAALDVGTNPVHDVINENAITANAIMFLDHVGMPIEYVNAIVNNPIVRRFVSHIQNDNMPPFVAFQEIGLGKETISDIVNNEFRNPVFTTNEIASDPTVQAIAFANAYYAGKQLSELYRAITPDNSEDMGDVSLVEEYLDRKDTYMRMKRPLVDGKVVNEILSGDRHILERSFYEMMEVSMDVASQLFIGGNQSTRTFKNNLKKIFKVDGFNDAQHRLIDRALFYHMLTKKGSPLEKFLDAQEIKDLFTDPKNTFMGRVRGLVNRVPNLRQNTLINKLTETTGYDKKNNLVFGVMLDKSDKMIAGERDELITSFESLMSNPEIYTQDEIEQKNIKLLAKALIQYAIVGNGLAPGYGAYHDLIPVRFFESVNKDGLSLASYMRQEFKKVKTDPNYFADFTNEFIINYAARSAGNKTIANVEKDVRSGRSKNSGAFLVRSNSAGPDSYMLWIKNSEGSYVSVKQKSIKSRLNEVNLRDKNGEIMEQSIFPNRLGMATIPTIPTESETLTVLPDNNEQEISC